MTERDRGTELPAEHEGSMLSVSIRLQPSKLPREAIPLAHKTAIPLNFEAPFSPQALGLRRSPGYALQLGLEHSYCQEKNWAKIQSS